MMEWGRPKKRKLMGEINVVPLIDVMLVLLIVFMITAPLITQGIKVDLPKINAELIEPSEELSLEVWINSEGLYFISLGAIEPENPPSVPLEQIGESVSKIVAANPGVPIFIWGDQGIEYRKVIELLSILSDAGVEGVSLITDPPEMDQ